MRKNRVLISAYIGSENLGDEAIFNSILSNLDVQYSDITAVSVNEKKTKLSKVSTVYAKNIIGVARAIKKCDVMLIGGGGIIQDQSSILNLIYYSIQMTIAKYYHKPVIFCFTGVGPIRSKVGSWTLSILAPSIRYAIVRDKKSKKILSNFMDSSKIYQASDPALNIKPRTRLITKHSDYAHLKPYFIISIRRWFFTISFLPTVITKNLNKLNFFNKRYRSYINSLASDLDIFLDNNPSLNAILVPLYNPEDSVVNNDLMSLMRNKDRLILFKTRINEQIFLSVAQNAEFIIGMRLHSLILGASVNKPFISLSYSDKVDEFTKQMGMTNYSVDIENYDSAKMQKILSYFVDNGPSIKKRISSKSIYYKRKNTEAFRILNKKIKHLLQK